MTGKGEGEIRDQLCVCGEVKAENKSSQESTSPPPGARERETVCGDVQTLLRQPALPFCPMPGGGPGSFSGGES